MNFEFSDDQETLRGLAAKIFEDHGSSQRLREVERSPEPFDRDLWAAVAAAGLLGAGVEEPYGSGMGLSGVCLVLEEMGRRVTPLPLWASACVSGMTLDRFGAASLRDRLLPGVCDGSLIVAPALEEPLQYSPATVATTVLREDGGWRLSGEKVAVPYATVADHFLVTATCPDGSVGVFVVDRDQPGVTVQAAMATTGEPLGLLQLSEAPVDSERLLLGAPGEAAAYAYRVGLAGLCATAAGVLDGGLRITAGYIGQREQFGRPIAAFQGPAMRIADAYIDSHAVWVATWSAIWRLESGRPADEALAIAKFWVADGGQRAVHAFQHLHGGIGVDVDYPIHRYFVWAKSLEATLGGASVQLEQLGRILAVGA